MKDLSRSLAARYTVALALQQCCQPPLEATWWDARLPLDQLFTQLDAPGCCGLLVNVQRTAWWSLRMLKTRHWYALRRAESAGFVWDLDSNLAEPVLLADAALRDRLAEEIGRGAHIFVVGAAQAAGAT